MRSPSILILYAHPGADISRANRTMLDAVKSSPRVIINDLYQNYPDFHIDLVRERTLLMQADLIILQHPIHWYSMPALQKEWLDQVLERGWAFGPGGTALQGKDFLLVATTGADAASYQSGERHGYPFEEFLPPYRQTAQLCGMHWHPPFLLHAASDVSQTTLAQHAAHYRTMLDQYPHWPQRQSTD
ncbi:glutathione-regulated potassium-efflux system ancillary protein KefF [Herbaspirillum sp. Sphag1AN]|uniref:glutathione-regulated potassium-efflux system oxidoreductase KefF n=1 Tax=unclassified Herbaspirillum TaxID=2624150 RepID=UPI0016182967|nr:MULTISPECIES: NAD(P)H-dependent oxidoreductase [unclassified Herbaspirillum]MBB3213935.1 glutathione-regulated potassium-efflux system ancillary protein KefF [Herbaspirillum sp. Sphag1AN]MBB3247132.1 glutathione-regulated potassium-efflux system ancillary protein KefF [Herbaspirillum sp. Sphag64]